MPDSLLRAFVALKAIGTHQAGLPLWSPGHHGMNGTVVLSWKHQAVNASTHASQVVGKFVFRNHSISTPSTYILQWKEIDRSI